MQYSSTLKNLIITVGNELSYVIYAETFINESQYLWRSKENLADSPVMELCMKIEVIFMYIFFQFFFLYIYNKCDVVFV